MRLGDLPHGTVRQSRGGEPLYLPQAAAPVRPARGGAPRGAERPANPRPASARPVASGRSAARRATLRRGAVLSLAAAIATLFLTLDRTGEQGVIAAVLGDRPAWAAPLSAADPGVALSPHFDLSGAPAAAISGAALPLADGGKGDLRMVTVSRAGAPRAMAPLDGILASADASALPRVAFVRPRAAPPEASGKAAAPAPAAMAEAAMTSMLTAYAGNQVDLEVPFRALLRPEAEATPKVALPYGVSGNGLDHWWSDRPLPESTTTEKQITCLAQAIYFEARGETLKGQEAVAQVVINRVKNPAYPDDVCAVVYQNRSWYNRCQFTFACDRIKDVVRNEAAWDDALRIATAYANGEMWLPEIGASTHYHAESVSPAWANIMRRVKTIDHHVFYLTLNGGWT